MRKDILYIALSDMTLASDGVSKKIKMEAHAMQNNGNLVDIAAYDGDAPTIFSLTDIGELEPTAVCNETKGLRRVRLFNFISQYVKTNEYSKAYIRYPHCTGDFLRLLRALRAEGIEPIIEIAAYPIQWHRPTSMHEIVTHTVFRSGDMLNCRKIKKYVDRMYVVGDPVNELWGIPVKNIPNGIVVDEIPMRSPVSFEDELHILFSANFYLYQGADRLIDGLAEYVKKEKDNKKKVFIELAGDGPELGKYRSQVKMYGVEEYVNFHGFISGEQYNALFDRCQIACSCLACHRVDMKYASPLKSKDYMSRGIPYVYAYEEIGMLEGYKYAKQIKSEESPISIEELMAFYDTYKDNQMAVANEMREFAISRFTWEKLLEDV